MNEPVVFLPGLMCDARLFGPQIAELSSDRAVMCAPISQGERIEEIASDLLDVLPTKFALAGLSMGGIVAMEILRRAPERVTRIALMDTNPLPETPQAAAAREPQIIGARSGRLSRSHARRNETELSGTRSTTSRCVEPCDGYGCNHGARGVRSPIACLATASRSAINPAEMQSSCACFMWGA